MHRLILFAKAPDPGYAKTRLVPSYSASEAALLAEAFLLDEVARFAALPKVQLTVAYAPAGAEILFRRLLADWPWIDLQPQSNGDLGERLSGALMAVLPSGLACVIGADSPDLPPEYVSAAFAALEAGTDLALGPTPDGGYYLIGMRKFRPELFRQIPWSTPGVFSATIRAAETLGWRVERLPEWSDVDVAADVTALRSRLRTAPADVAPRTRGVLERLSFRKP